MRAQSYFEWQNNNRNGDFYELFEKERLAFKEIPVIYYKEQEGGVMILEELKKIKAFQVDRGMAWLPADPGPAQCCSREQG